MQPERPAVRWWFPAAMMSLGGTILLIAAIFSPAPDSLGGWIIGTVLWLAAFTSWQRRRHH